MTMAGKRPEFDIRIFPYADDPKPVLGLTIDEYSLIISQIDEEGMAFRNFQRWQQQEEAKEPDQEKFLENPIEVGDQIVAFDEESVIDLSRNQLLALFKGEIEQESTIRIRRAFERRRLADEREDKEVLVEDGVVIIDEGEEVEGISETQWIGKIIKLKDNGMKGYGRITCSEELAATIGFREVPTPSYMLCNGELAEGDRVLLHVKFNHDGRPRGCKVEKAPAQPKPPPRVAAPKPFPDDTSWSYALNKADAKQTRRPEHHGLSAATFGGKRPALAKRDSAEIGEELGHVRAGQAMAVQPLDPEVLSNPESEDSVDSISGGIERPWAEGRVDARTLYGRDRAVGFSEGWQPMQWTEHEWERKLSQAGELGPKPPPPRNKEVLARFRKAGWKIVAAIKLNKMVGLEFNLDEPLVLDDDDDDCMSPEERERRRRSTLQDVAAKLEEQGVRRGSGSSGEGSYGKHLTLTTPRASISIKGFTRESVAARDAQTATVTKLLRQGLPEKEVVKLLRNGLEDHPTLVPPKKPTLRSPEIFEAKGLLESLALLVKAKQDKLDGKTQRPVAGPRGWVDHAGFERNLALYACRPPRPAGPPPTAAKLAAPKVSRTWL